MTIPGVDSATAAALIAGRPYNNMVAVNRVLTQRNLTEQQRDTVFTRFWIPIDLNTATREEIMLIPGVGEKTAAMLINKYGNAEKVLDHLDELTPKLRENFQNYGERIPMARRLVTLKTDVEFQFDVAQCRYTGLNVDGLKPHLLERVVNNLGAETVVRYAS